MIQAPNLYNPYVQQAPCVQPLPAPNYNAVKIELHNPAVNAPNIGPVSLNAPQYTQPSAVPYYYSYPQTQLYDYQQAAGQPYYPPVTNPMAYMPPIQQPEAVPAQNTFVNEPARVIQQQNINLPPAANVPEPVITEAVPMPPKAEEKAGTVPADKPKVEIQEPVQIKPQVDLNAFLAKLTNPDYDIQAAAMEEIANMVKDTPQKAVELLDEKVINSLVNIINNDSSKLAGPTQPQIAARQKLMNGEKLTEEETKLATTITPMEQSERNKSYAMFTISIMDKLYGDEVTKLTNNTVPLTELPGAVPIVEQLKNKPNPMVRASAIEALSYIQHPAYKQDLNTLFSIAKNDQDKNVQDAANIALSKLEQIK